MSDSVLSVSNLSIAKYVFSFVVPNELEIKSSAFKINLVSTGKFLFIMFNINSGCAFLLMESLNKLVQTRYVGLTYGNTFGELLSSISNTAISYLVLFLIFTPDIKAAAIPASILDPNLLSSTL